MLMWMHPLAQTAALGVAVLAYALAWRRLAQALAGRTGAPFDWARHVRLGALALSVWGAGFFFGMGAVYFGRGVVWMNGPHSWTGAGMLPLIAFGLGSGAYMDRMKARRRALPLAHGLANSLLLALAVFQAVSGIGLAQLLLD